MKINFKYRVMCWCLAFFCVMSNVSIVAGSQTTDSLSQGDNNNESEYVLAADDFESNYEYDEENHRVIVTIALLDKKILDQVNLINTYLYVRDQEENLVQIYRAEHAAQGLYKVYIEADDLLDAQFEYNCIPVIYYGNLGEHTEIVEQGCVKVEAVNEQANTQIELYPLKINVSNWFDGNEEVSNDISEPELYDAKEPINGEASSTPQVTALLSEDEKILTMSAIYKAPEDSNGSLRFAIWNDANAQSDLRWIIGKKTIDGYSESIYVSELSGIGTYTIHSYYFDDDEGPIFVGGVRINISAPKVESIVVSEPDLRTGAFSIQMKGIVCKSGINQIRVAVWSADDQSNSSWYVADDSYNVSCNLSRHGFLSGQYKIHVYIVDGNGFMTYVGGTTKDIHFETNLLYVEDIDGKQIQYNISLSAVKTSASDIRFAVWSDENGQDDLRWYSGENFEGVFSAVVRVEDHGSLGEYNVHAYAFDVNGTPTYLKGTTFFVDSPTKADISITNTDKGFQAQIKGIDAPSGITNVVAAVWNEENPGGLRWTNLENIDGIYFLNVDVSDYNMYQGEYIVHLYATDGNGIMSYCGGKRVVQQVSCSSMGCEETENGYDIFLRDITLTSVLQNIRIAVWSEKNGQDDLKWYNAVENSDGYTIHIDSESLVDGGNYVAHAYGVDLNGNLFYITGCRFVINGILSIGEITSGNIPITVSDLNDTNRVKIFVCPDNGSNGIVYTAQVQNDNSCEVIVPLADFGYYFGDYAIVAYAVLNDGTEKKISEKTIAVNLERGSFSDIETINNRSIYVATLKDVNLMGIAESVQFAVWSNENGQDDLHWYPASVSSDGYTVQIPASDYSTWGEFVMHAYCFPANGSPIYINGIRFHMAAPSESVIGIKNMDSQKGTFTIEESLGTVDYTVKGLRAGVWGTGGTVVWYTMTKVGDSLYTATVDASNHNYFFGEYIAHIYAEDTSGGLHFINGVRTTLSADNIVAYEKMSSSLCKITIYGANYLGQTLIDVKMGVWSVDGNMDDFRWVDAVNDGEGNYSVVVNRSDYNRSGEFSTHVYFWVNGQPIMVSAVNYTLYYSDQFDEYSQTVMHNIIFAVETGGQVYGNARYDCFAPAFNISSKETAITIGAGGWFATEAQKLLIKIRKEDPVLFASLDTQGIGKDLDNENWQYYGSDGNGNRTITSGSAKAKCIQALISSSAGIRVQNRLVDQQMAIYVNEAKNLGVTDLKAQMFLANIRHLGGYTPMKWVVNCCKEDGKSLTMLNLYNSMRDHTTNKAGNGVGADKYNSRHVKVMGWLDKYIV